MARIRLISVGSRGDLQPYLAILLELQRRGHRVTMIGSVNFQAVAEAQAVPFVPLPGDFTKLLRTEQGLKLMQDKPVQLISDALLSELLETAHPAMEGTDLLLVSPLCLWGYHLAEATGDFPLLGFPASPTSETGGGLRRRLRRRPNRSSYRLVSLLKWRQDARVIQAFRHERLGLKPLPWGGAQSRRTPPAHLVDPPVLHLISPQILPRPADWKASAALTGFCFLEPRSPEGAILSTPYSPDQDLAASIRALASEPRFRQRAQELQQCLAREDGVACTVEAIEAQLDGGRR